ncbi:antigen WC1.1-like [Osmerus mordax]|uniref:antigen WC1.1-like n=1 Tax=Osmerus mordax TaxID=8014 RepID=UPI00350EC801
MVPEILSMKADKLNESEVFYSPVETQSEREMLPVLMLVVMFWSTGSDVRLVDGGSRCAGRVEMKHQEEWRRLYSYIWNVKQAAVVCRELDCGSAVSTREYDGDEDRPVWEFVSDCAGTESDLRECGHVWDGVNTSSMVEVICSESVRLVEGAGWCSGRVEVRSDQSWVSVCEADFDRLDAEVVCRQLGCGAPSVLQGALYGEGKGPLWDKEFQCGGKESRLLDCDTSDSGRNTCSPGSAVELTCISESVRLVEGAGWCSGRVEVRSDESWVSVCEADFDRLDAEVVCRQLGCGAPSALQGALYGEGKGPLWDKEFQCGGKESRLLDCDTSDSARNTCSPGSAVGLTCSESSDVRLLDGGSRCAGRVEMKHQEEWRQLFNRFTWNMETAAVVCRQLECGSAVSTRGYDGDENRRHPAWWFESDCAGTESALRECGHLKGGVNSSSMVDVICSDLLFQPGISLSSSMLGVSQDQQQGLQVFRDHSFTITCSIQPQYPGGSFHLTFTGSNTTLTHTLTAVNHSANFLFPAADHTHQGNYSCVYEVYVFSHNFTSETNPLPAFIIRVVVVLLTLLTPSTALYLCFKSTPQSEVFYSPVETQSEREMLPVLMLVVMFWSTGSDVRLVDGGSRCAGRVEMKHQEEWRQLYSRDYWNMKHAAVVCRQLDCGSAVSIRKYDGDEDRPTWSFESDCAGTESDLRECGPVGEGYNSLYVAEVICSESVRLVEGAGWCSGRVEVRSDQSWVSVCEADFDRLDAEVVCRQLGCGAPSVLQGALYGEGKGPLWDKEFQCGGKESRLLDCDTSDSGRNTCSPGSAVGLTCSGSDVRLVDGGSRCAGRVEIKHQEEWRQLYSSDYWSMKYAAIVCRQLDCGSAVSTRVYDGDEDRPTWGFKSDCAGTESDLRECGYVLEEFNGFNTSLIVEVICSESVRLVEGAGLCSGRVEVRSDESWVSVCEADFDRLDAEVVCRQLGCGAPSVLQGALYGEGKGPLWDKEFQCGGKESRLLACDTSDSGRNTCSPGSAVGLTCSESSDVRLLDGGSRCAGRVEMKHQEEWRQLYSWSTWVMEHAAVVCRQLDCGSAVSTREYGGDEHRPAWGFESDCAGTESDLRKCGHVRFTTNSSSVVEVICSDLLFQPGISLSSSMLGVSQDQQQGLQVFRDHSFTITCSIQPQYPGGSFHLTFTGSNTTLTHTLTAVNHSANFLFPAADHTHQGNYSCVYEVYVFSHNFTSETNPLPAFIIRVVVVLLTLLTPSTALYLCFKSTPQSEVFYSPVETQSEREMLPVLMLVVMFWSTGSDVRLVDGGSRCAGRVEIKHQEEWRQLDSMVPWSMKQAVVVCRQLDCGSAVSIRKYDGDEDRPAWEFGSTCAGTESALRECGRVYEGISGDVMEVICSESVRLVEGAGWCSGRVEVRSDESWVSVCEADFDRMDAEVVCRELGCGAPSVLQGALYGEGKGPLWDKEFQCGGKESRLLDCDTSDSARNTCSPGSAVGLTCSGSDVRLVDGGSRCAGRVEMKHQEEWRQLDSGSTWSMEHAAVVCKQLDCGSAVSTRKYRESVRLVEGAGWCSGRVEVRSDESWVSVCEADFDRLDAEVVCRQLGCGAPSVLQGALYGEGKGPLWDKEFQCGGKESRLLDCDTSDSARNTCSPGSAVGLTCSGPNVRLVDGGSRCAGRVEIKHQEEWRQLYSGSTWNTETAAVVCRQLDCGSAVSTRGYEDDKYNPVWKFESECAGTESALRECGKIHKGIHTSTVWEVTCSDLLFQPGISLSSSMLGVSQDQQQGLQVFRDHSFTITCSIQPQYPGGSFHLTFTGSNTTLRHTLTGVHHSANFLFPAADHAHQGNYSCVYEVYIISIISHNFTSESELLSLTVAANPLPAFIIRVVVVLLTLLTPSTALYLYFKTTRKPAERESMELVSLHSSAEAGPGEERAAQRMEQEESAV